MQVLLETPTVETVANTYVSKPTENAYVAIVGDQDPITVVQKLASTVQDTYYDLGCVLYNLKEFDQYQKVNSKYDKPNHGGWKDFCDEQLPGVSYRTAQYWVNLYRYFREMNISKDQAKAVGWSKAKELIDLCDSADDLQKALKFAETHTLEEVKAYVQTYNTREGDDTRDIVVNKRYTFSLSGEAAAAVDDILQMVAENNGGDMNAAFFEILLDYKLLRPSIYAEAQLNIEGASSVEF